MQQNTRNSEAAMMSKVEVDHYQLKSKKRSKKNKNKTNETSSVSGFIFFYKKLNNSKTLVNYFSKI